MRMLIFLLFIISMSNAMEIPAERPKVGFICFSVDPGAGFEPTEACIFPSGSINLPEQPDDRDATVDISTEEVEAIFKLTRTAVLSAKISNNVEGATGRQFTVMYDYDGSSLHFNLNEKVIEKGLYDKMAEKMRMILSKYKAERRKR